MTRGSQIRFWLLGVAIFLLSLWLLRSVLLPFVAGMAVAYLLDPLAERLQRWGMSRLVATTLITVAFFLLLVGGLALLVPLLEDQITSFAAKLPAYYEGLAQWIKPLIFRAQKSLSPSDFAHLKESIGSYAGTAVGWVVSVVQEVLTSGLAVVNILSLIFIMPVVTFYMLRDWHRLVSAVDSWLPRDHAPTIRQELQEINRTLSGFIRGQGMVMLSLAFYYGVGLSLVGLDLGLVVGISAGLASFIPYLGTISGFAAGLALAFAQTGDWHLPALVAGVFLVGNLIEGNFLTPRLVGNRVGLHPVWIIFALLAGGALFGFLGILLAVPTAAVIGVLVRFMLRNYLASSLYRGINPQP